MQKKILRVSVSVLMGSLFMPCAQAMDVSDQLPQHLNFAKARFTLQEDIGGLYRIATPSLMSDDNTKIQVAIKIREAYWHWQTHPGLSKYMPDFQFIARGVMQGVSPGTEQIIKSILNFLNLNALLENTQDLASHSASTNERREPKNLIPHFTDKSQNFPQQSLISSVTFQKEEEVIVAPKTCSQPDETSLEEQIKNTLSSESLDIINPLLELYKKLHQKHWFENFQTNIWEMYRDIPTTSYPDLETHLKDLTVCLEDVLSSPNNTEFKTALISKKRNLRNFYNSTKTQKTLQRKRARATRDDGCPRQKIRRIGEATPMK